MSKVKQKVSGCFRTRKYAEAYCRISSYLQSMANQGYNPLVAIQSLSPDAPSITCPSSYLPRIHTRTARRRTADRRVDNP